MIDDSIEYFIVNNYSEDTGNTLFSLLERLDNLYATFDPIEMINMLPGFNGYATPGSAADELRGYIVSRSKSLLGEFGVRVDDSIPINRLESFLRTIEVLPLLEQKDELLSIMEFEDNETSFLKLVEYVTGVDHNRLFIYIESIDNVIVSSIKSLLANAPVPDSTVQNVESVKSIQKLTEKYGANIGNRLLHMEVPTGLPMYYYHGLIPDKLGTDPFSEAKDILSLAILSKHKVDRDEANKFIEEIYKDNRLMGSEVSKYISIDLEI